MEADCGFRWPIVIASCARYFSSSFSLFSRCYFANKFSIQKKELNIRASHLHFALFAFLYAVQWLCVASMSWLSGSATNSGTEHCTLVSDCTHLASTTGPRTDTASECAATSTPNQLNILLTVYFSCSLHMHIYGVNFFFSFSFSPSLPAVFLCAVAWKYVWVNFYLSAPHWGLMKNFDLSGSELPRARAALTFHGLSSYAHRRFIAVCEDGEYLPYL